MVRRTIINDVSPNGQMIDYKKNHGFYTTIKDVDLSVNKTMEISMSWFDEKYENEEGYIVEVNGPIKDNEGNIINNLITGDPIQCKL